jgi:tetratricopeptide (TPR) repeat protein
LRASAISAPSCSHAVFTATKGSVRKSAYRPRCSGRTELDPANAAALEFKRSNDNLLLAQRGKIPSPDVMARVPEIQDKKLTAATLVQNGRLLYENGELDESEAKLTEALKLDPDNSGASPMLPVRPISVLTSST